MPDLQEHAAAAWLADVRSVEPVEDWPPAIRAIEQTEDGPALLAELGEMLDDLAAADAERLSAVLRQEPLCRELQAVLAQTGAARALRVLHWLHETDLPASHMILTALTQGGGAEARALRAMIAAVTRRSTLRRLFAPQRLADLRDVAKTAVGPKLIPTESA